MKKETISTMPGLEGNQTIKKAIEEFSKNENDFTFEGAITAIMDRALEMGHFIIPVEQEDDVKKKLDGVSYGDDVSFQMNMLEDKEGKYWMAVFTDQEEVEQDDENLDTGWISDTIASIFGYVCDMEEIAGIIVNPWSDSGFVLERELVMMLNEQLDLVAQESKILLLEGDITQLDVDAIVNAANNTLLGGSGVDGAIHRAAGPELLEECRNLHGCKTGDAKMTWGYNLPAEYVIHTVGPIYSGTEADAELLESCYWNSLELAAEAEMLSIAFPCISTGVFGYPKKEAAAIAVRTVDRWLKENSESGMTVIFCIYNDEEMASIYDALLQELDEE